MWHFSRGELEKLRERVYVFLIASKVYLHLHIMNRKWIIMFVENSAM